eukprot:TRINITY_DN13956_c0_g2_i2.p1 TRINITY_DN13956_c0_g2~~TRINITY_DN13956_c0_g2_i2.p1  ORF type:complete len:356 (+),score=125.00 TRINITY_DN13956_c0_g2_i2:89-1156(+)
MDAEQQHAPFGADGGEGGGSADGPPDGRSSDEKRSSAAIAAEALLQVAAEEAGAKEVELWKQVAGGVSPMLSTGSAAAAAAAAATAASLADGGCRDLADATAAKAGPVLVVLRPAVAQSPQRQAVLHAARAYACLSGVTSCTPDGGAAGDGPPQPLWREWVADPCEYVVKLRGVGGTPLAPASWPSTALTFTGVFLTMLAISGINESVKEESGGDRFLVIGSLGALNTLLWSAWGSPLSQPKNVLLGHFVSAAIGVIVWYLVGDEHEPVISRWVAIALTPALAIASMAKLGITHPPAGAVSLIFVSGGAVITDLGWVYVALPAVGSAALCVLMAVVINNLSPARQYPNYWITKGM